MNLTQHGFISFLTHNYRFFFHNKKNNYNILNKTKLYFITLTINCSVYMHILPRYISVMFTYYVKM